MYFIIFFLLKNPLATVKSIAKHLGIPCTETLAEEIVHKCKLENMRSANKHKYDDRNQSGPNPDMIDPDKMYRKGWWQSDLYNASIFTSQGLVVVTWHNPLTHITIRNREWRNALLKLNSQ
jgi:hypothetical protein